MTKRLSSAFFIVLCFIGTAMPQENMPLKISDGKTTHLVFPSGVKYYDHGSEDVGVQETAEPNIIKVKAAVPGFEGTNLTVMTDDNVFYSFILEYERSPKILNYFFDASHGRSYAKKIPEGNIDGTTAPKPDSAKKPAPVHLNALLEKMPAEAYIVGSRKNGITLVLKDVFVDGESLYFALDAVNQSVVNYDVDFIKFFVKPRKKGKRSTIQDVEILPKSSFNAPNTLTDADSGLFVFVFDKFTLSGDKKLVVEMWERNGERSIELEIGNRALLGAKRIERKKN